MTEMLPLAKMAEAVLSTACGREKTALSRRFAAQWQGARDTGALPPIGHAHTPLRPARPNKPDLLDPRDVPRRRTGTQAGRIALLHAVADHTAPGGSCATYSAAGCVRAALAEAGFAVCRVPGYGRKRHMTRGRL